MSNASIVCRCFFIALAFSVSPLVSADRDLSGHWEGYAVVFNNTVELSFDLVTSPAGTITGTMSQPAEGIRHLPLLRVDLVDATVNIVAREDQPLEGMLSGDGKTIEGLMRISGYEIPVTLSHMGDARVEPPVAIPPVASRFTGTWHGNLGGSQLNLIIRNAEESASAEIINLNQGNLTIPAAGIEVDEDLLTLDLAAVSGAFTGRINADGTTLEGDFIQGAAQVPLVFNRQ